MPFTFEKILKEYETLKLDEVVDFNKFNEYTVVHHSTAIEGSTLTEIETQVLLEKGLTPKGKPAEHTLMSLDHYQALQYVIEKAKKGVQPVTLPFIQKINSLVLKSTGLVRNTVFGTIDERKGEFRKGNVKAGNTYFINYDKVIPYTKELVSKLNEQMNNIRVSTPRKQIMELTFKTHFDLVSIHPFYDGNGRTSRLLMNYLQAVFNLPMSIVFKEDRTNYIKALEDARRVQNVKPFCDFMFTQIEKQLRTEIHRYKESINKNEKGFTLCI